jgi:hypothetical protein
MQVRMQVRMQLAAALALLVFGASSAQGKDQPSDAQVRKILIAESRDAYSGNCPCPYDVDRAGRRCGKRSAYSRPGGEAPLCYDHDVTKEMIEAYRQRNSGS